MQPRVGFDKGGMASMIAHLKTLKSGAITTIPELMVVAKKKGWKIDQSSLSQMLKKIDDTQILEPEPDGRIDYRKFNMLKRIKKGECIITKKKATIGDFEGFTVCGEKISPQHGKDIELSYNENVTAKEDKSEIKYISNINGHYSFTENCLIIDPVLLVEGDVDYASGNIDFEGDVNIMGDILDKFEVSTMKNLFVMGSVNAAKINVEGDMFVQKGIIGRHNSEITVRGTLVVDFIEAADIKIYGDLIVNRSILNSNIKAAGKIICVSGKGQIIGGVVQAAEAIEANIIGSEGGVKTEIIAGIDFSLERDLALLEKEKLIYNKNLQKIIKLTEKLFSIKPTVEEFSVEMRKIYIESLKKKTLILKKIEDIKINEIHLLSEIEELNKAYIKINKTVFTDTKININRSIMEITKLYQSVKFIKDTTRNKIRILKKAKRV